MVRPPPPGGKLVWAYFGKAKFSEGKFWSKILGGMFAWRMPGALSLH